MYFQENIVQIINVDILTFFQTLMAALPNFFPHFYNIYREELPHLEKHEFKNIFMHDRENILGTGSNNTVVYKGKFGSRLIAIKRVTKSNLDTVEREIDTLMKVEGHPYILQYFAKEVDKEYFYIGTELCNWNLVQFVADKLIERKLETKLIFQQTVEGLSHLHSLKISNN